jgi:hypothetical protein
VVRPLRWVAHRDTQGPPAKRSLGYARDPHEKEKPMNESPVTCELTGVEGGVWRVSTQGSAHILDLDVMTVTRIPGLGRPASFNDVTRPLRTLEVCRVGEAGRWTMHSDDETIEFFWHISSRIRRIEALPTSSEPPETNDSGHA